jgi:hypothetical protein
VLCGAGGQRYGKTALGWKKLAMVTKTGRRAGRVRRRQEAPAVETRERLQTLERLLLQITLAGLRLQTHVRLQQAQMKRQQGAVLQPRYTLFDIGHRRRQGSRSKSEE